MEMWLIITLFGTSKGELYLIDFDLISIGPIMADYLQYANRILPFLNWSLPNLATYKQIQPIFSNRYFCMRLLFQPIFFENGID